MTTPLILKGSDAPAAGYALAPDAALVVLDDSDAFVLDMAGAFHAVTPIGALMLRRTLEAGPDAAAEEVAASYGAEPARVRRDLQHLLDDMTARGMLRRPGAPVPRQQRSRMAGLLALLAALALRVVPAPSLRAAALLLLARCSFALCGWTATFAAWKARLQRPTAEAVADAAAIDRLVRAVAPHLWLGVDCKERALTCWTMAQQAGLSAVLVVGIRPHPLSAHCWCETATRIISDESVNCARYLPVFAYR
jgi:Transglutaminase-like superfamily